MHEKSYFYLLITYVQNASQKVKKERWNFGSARTICNLHSSYMKNALVFSQSDARNVYYKSWKTLTSRSRHFQVKGFLVLAELVDRGTLVPPCVVFCDYSYNHASTNWLSFTVNQLYELGNTKEVTWKDKSSHCIYFSSNKRTVKE